MHVDLSTLLLQLINFAILVWLLQRFLYRPVLRMMDARRSAIDAQLSAAQEAERQAKEARSKIDAERAHLAQERVASAQAATVEAERLRAERHALAEREAYTLIEQTRSSLAEERARAQREAQRVALDLAAEITRRLWMQMPAAARTEGWFERILSTLDRMSVEQRRELPGRERGLRVVTAVALEPGVQARWRAELSRLLGPLEVSFESSPELGAGAELRFSGTTLALTLRSAIDDLTREGSGADAS